MKTKGILLVLLLSLPAWGDNVTSKRLVDVGFTKAVVFEETVSPDGRYAVGWTFLLHGKDAKPVDWSLWKPDDDAAVDNFIQTYASYLPDPITDKEDYELVNCLIDLKEKRFLELPTDGPDYPHRNRGYIVVKWGPTVRGIRYALVESDARFSTENLWLITIDSSGMHQKDIADVLQKSVDPIVKEKRPLKYDSYETGFSVAPEQQQPDGPRPVAFHGSTFTIPFYSDIPKFGDDFSPVQGTVAVKIPEGTVVKAVSDTPRDDPFQDIPALAKADHDLNQIYSQLSQKLPPARRADLKKEQLDWIDQRDDVAAEALRNSQGDGSAHDPRDDRNKSLLESTQKRIGELKTRLAALH